MIYSIKVIPFIVLGFLILFLPKLDGAALGNDTEFEDLPVSTTVLTGTGSDSVFFNAIDVLINDAYLRSMDRSNEYTEIKRDKFYNGDKSFLVPLIEYEMRIQQTYKAYLQYRGLIK